MFSPNRTIRNLNEIYQPLIITKIKEEEKNEPKQEKPKPEKEDQCLKICIVEIKAKK